MIKILVVSLVITSSKSVLVWDSGLDHNLEVKIPKTVPGWVYQSTNNGFSNPIALVSAYYELVKIL